MAQPPSQADRVSTLVNDLIALEERLRLGRPSHAAFDEHEEEASRIANSLRAIFRGAAPRHAPLARTATGAWF